MGKVVSGITRTLFGGGSSSQQSTQQSSSQLDPRMFDMFNQNRQRATNVANQLGVRQFADFTPDFYTGRDQILSTIGGPGQRAVEAAQRGTARGMNFSAAPVTAGSFLNANIDDYMNPFLNIVAANTMSDMDRARQMTQMQNADAAARAGAFGGSRQGVLEAETNRAFFDRLGNTLGALYAGGFDTASGLARGDIDRTFAADLANQQAMLNANQQRLAAAGQLGTLGNLGQQMALQSGEAATNLGFVQQQLDQARLDAIRNLPLEQQAIINEALGLNVGGGSGMVSTSSGQMTGSGSQQSGIIPGLFGSSGLVPGIAATSLLLSDERAKENVEKIDDPLGKVRELAGYSYNYMGSDKPAAGVMAQDVERVMPGALDTAGNGMKMVDYAAVTGLLVEAVNELAKQRGR